MIQISAFHPRPHPSPFYPSHNCKKELSRTYIKQVTFLSPLHPQDFLIICFGFSSPTEQDSESLPGAFKGWAPAASSWFASISAYPSQSEHPSERHPVSVLTFRVVSGLPGANMKSVYTVARIYIVKSQFKELSLFPLLGTKARIHGQLVFFFRDHERQLQWDLPHQCQVGVL